MSSPGLLSSLAPPTSEQHEEVVGLYLKAARLSPEGLDADVQVSCVSRVNLSNPHSSLGWSWCPLQPVK